MRTQVTSYRSPLDVDPRFTQNKTKKKTTVVWVPKSFMSGTSEVGGVDNLRGPNE